MNKVVIILIMSLGGMIPGLVAAVMAQNANLPVESEPFPAILRVEGLWRRSSPASPGAWVPQANPYSSSQVVDFESNEGSWTVTRTLKITTKSNKNGLMDNLTTFISVSKDTSSATAANKDKPSLTTNKEKFSAVPSGVKIGSGLAFYLPISQSFLAYAQLKPSFSKNIIKTAFTTPQTMLATGFHVPLINAASLTDHNVSLKFNAAVDGHFRPIMSFTINLTPAKR